MRYTIKFGTYFGIPVRIHLTFPLILLVFGVDGWRSGGWGEAVWAVALVAAVFVCVVLHEFGHSLQVRRYGIKVRDIVLLPIGGMARAERIPEDPVQEIIVAISGPLVNFALAAIFFLILRLRNVPLDLDHGFLVNLMVINIILGVFNLIPAFPMDGGRILRGVFATRMSYLKATRYAKNIGQVIAIGFAILGFADQRFIMLPLIGVFIFFSAMSEEKMIRIRIGLGEKWARDFIVRGNTMLFPNSTVESAAASLEPGQPFALPITNADGSLVGAVEATDVRQAMKRGMGGTPLEPWVKTEFPLIDAGTSAMQAYYILHSHKRRLAGIMENGQFLGLVFYDDLTAAIA